MGHEMCGGCNTVPCECRDYKLGHAQSQISPEKLSAFIKTIGSFPPITFKHINPEALLKATKEYHPVTKPEHYNKKGIECIQAIEAAMTKEEFEGYLRGNVIKYVWRYKYKNKMQDLEKAQWYLNKLIEVYGKSCDQETQK